MSQALYEQMPSSDKAIKRIPLGAPVSVPLQITIPFLVLNGLADTVTDIEVI